MSRARIGLVTAVLSLSGLGACGEGGAGDASVHDAWVDDASGLDASGHDALVDARADLVVDASDLDASPAPDAEGPDGTIDAGARDAIDAERERLLETYLERLESIPDVLQSNGVRGRDVSDVCTLWAAMPPSSRSVFLTITARLGGARLGADGTLALAHVTRLYRVAGGGGETASEIGSCGGGENNRLVLSIDPTLHAAWLAAHDRSGAMLPGGARDVEDVIAASFWRDSGDLAGPHDPFTVSDETEGGAPRGQVHFFRETTSGPALAPLGRTDVETLVDPYALEVDQDYDCVHASNPLCEYVLYGPGCAPRTRRTGVEIYGESYGAIDLAWRPAGC